ncbi:hypothetical protein C8Q70DRAFT_963653 [Cubamyces menziesii]|nr:hypothetical protein C8Q70DRAFT_963653 [Cubamyces menziesii]
MPGVSKSMPAASSSSAATSDALTNLTRAATVAFTAVQEQARAEVAQLRSERDDALKALHEAQLDAKDLEMREEGWRAALEKSDMTIKHQAETIAQLRNEVDQWKTQLTRLEESTRQEIDDWKEQYRRAEHERSRLSARIDDLIAGQLAWNAAAHAYTTPYTPRVAYTEIPEPSASTSAPKRTSATQKTGGTPRRTARAPPNDDDEPPPPTARKTKTTAAQSSRNAVQRESDQRRSRGGSPIRPNAPRRKDQIAVEVPRASGSSRIEPRTPASRLSSAHRDSQTRVEPTQRVIRRVTAIVDVKEEEPDEEGLDDRESARSGSVYEPNDDPPEPPSNRKRRTSNATSRRRQVIQDWDEDEETPDVENDGETDQYEENPGDEEDEEEDDELLLGPKVRNGAPYTRKCLLKVPSEADVYQAAY